MTELTASSQATARGARWKWDLAIGGLLLVLGIFGLGFTTLLNVSSLLVFGPLLLVSSLMQLLQALFAVKPWGREALLHFAAAGLEAFLGFYIMLNPSEGVGGLVAWIAIILIAGGLIRLARSVTTRPRRRAWIVVPGVIALLLGVAVWLGWPATGLWFVGLCIAVDFICHGVGWSALALAERKPLPETQL
jgi:uncharacterized membrane protein HdeD (DUF308 family)